MKREKTLVKIVISVFLATILVAIPACASKKVVSGQLSHAKLFPDGNYRHEVSLTLAQHGDVPEKKFKFSGIVQIKPEAIHVVVLSPFGTTAFKINEDLESGEIQTEVYVSQFKKFEPKLKDYYLILREALLARSSGAQSTGHLKWLKTNAQGLPTEMETEGLDNNAKISITQFDQNEIPADFVIDQTHFKVEVRVTGYEI